MSPDDAESAPTGDLSPNQNVEVLNAISFL